MPDPAEPIRLLRQQSNAAIAARDAVAVAAFMTDDVTVAVAGGPVLRGRDANRDAFAEQMRTPGFGGYVRTPTHIVVEGAPVRATEVGTWEGRWVVKGRVHTQRGAYRAEWRVTEMGWQIAAEVYDAT